jgi:hypothetical protein
VSNDGHVTNICRLVHQGADFFDGKAALHTDISNDDLILTPEEDVEVDHSIPRLHLESKLNKA